MREETSINVPKRKSVPCQMVQGQFRTCQLNPTLSVNFEYLSQSEQLRARSSIKAFANRPHIESLPMHDRQPFVSLIDEQWTKIDGYVIFFFINPDALYVIFHMYCEDPDNDDDGGGDAIFAMPELQSGMDRVGSRCDESCKYEGSSEWQLIVHAVAVDFATILVNVLFGKNRMLRLIGDIANTCSSRLYGVGGGINNQGWRMTILSNTLYCHDINDVYMSLVPNVLEVPAVWVVARTPKEQTMPKDDIETRRQDMVSPRISIIANEQFYVELTVMQAPSGIWLFGLELAHDMGDRRVAAYTQLAATSTSRVDGGPEHGGPVAGPVGRLGVLLQR